MAKTRWYSHPKKRKIHVIHRVSPWNQPFDHFEMLCNGEFVGYEAPSRLGWKYIHCPNPPHGMYAQVCRACCKKLGVTPDPPGLLHR